MAEDSQRSEEERRFLDILEQAALHDYPNPERIGCPGTDFLRRLAFDRTSVSIDDPRLDHLGKCSPCFREFTAFKAEAKRPKTSAKRAGIIGLIAAAIALPAIWLWTRPARPGESSAPSGDPIIAEYAKAELDLKDRAVTRGGPKQPPAATNRLVLPRRPLELSILLPVGSETGDYEIQILREVDQPLLTATGTAQRVSGDTIIRLRIDLTKLPLGRYLLGVRQPPWDWSYNPLSLE